jgi:hypothetical protein
MKVRRSLTGLGWCLGIVMGCQSATPTQPTSAGGAGDSSSNKGGGSSSVPGGGSSSSTAGTSSSSSRGGSGGTGSEGEGGRVSHGGTTSDPEVSLTLTRAGAQRSGVRGSDILVTAEGEGEAGTLSSIEVTLLDAAGNEVPFFDSDWSSVGDTGVGRAVPRTLPGVTPFEATAVIPGAGSEEDVATAVIALVDNQGRISNSKKVGVAELIERSLGEGCDPTGVSDYCSQGYSCADSTCVAGTSPMIDRGVYQQNVDGPIARLEGTDLESDVIMIRLNFLDESSNPVALDLDGDDLPESSYFEAQVGLTSHLGGFTYYNESTPSFADQVPRLGLTAIDSQSHESDMLELELSTLVRRASGETCDLGGFDACEDDTTCVANKSGANGTCTTAVSARRARCAAGRSIDPSTGATRVTGWMEGLSYWDPPSICLAASSAGRPEAVVRIHLTKAVSKLTLSTAQPETTVDTVLFVASDCDSLVDPGAIIDCNDNVEGFASELVLTDLVKGDYYAVIESVEPLGGSFGLSVVAE